MNVTVREVAENDFFAWLPLFDAYCSSRGRRLDDTKALIVWSWIQEPRNALRAAGSAVQLWAWYFARSTIQRAGDGPCRLGRRRPRCSEPPRI